MARQNWTMRTRAYFAAIGLIFVAALAIAYWASGRLDRARTDINGEIFKNALQIAAVAIVGGFVALLYKEAQEQQAAKRQLDETRKDFLRKFRKVYFDVKKIRRLLSVAGLTEKFQNPPIELSDAQLNSYRENMLTLNELQLSFEDLNSEVDICLCHHMKTEGISKELRRMEQYLRSLVREFERFGGNRSAESKIKFESLAELRNFTGHAKKTPSGSKSGEQVERTFYANMSKPYWSVVKAIYMELSDSAANGKNAPLRFKA
jgi:DNA-binding transcriptional MerR regulator